MEPRSTKQIHIVIVPFTKVLLDSVYVLEPYEAPLLKMDIDVEYSSGNQLFPKNPHNQSATWQKISWIHYWVMFVPTWKLCLLSSVDRFQSHAWYLSCQSIGGKIWFLSSISRTRMYSNTTMKMRQCWATQRSYTLAYLVPQSVSLSHFVEHVSLILWKNIEKATTRPATDLLFRRMLRRCLARMARWNHVTMTLRFKSRAFVLVYQAWQGLEHSYLSPDNFTTLTWSPTPKED